MSNRAAIDTIAGYFYQFDYSISRLIELQDAKDTVTVEGIEDVDIKTLSEDSTIQCKYYAKSEYNHSIIAKPIRLMLNHFKEVKEGREKSVRYYLYGHYKSGHDKLPLPITVNFLKKHFLTYTKDKIEHTHHTELDLNDKDLELFLTKLSININGVSIETQFERLISKFIELFKCTRFQAEHYYYNNSLKVIREIAIQSAVENRQISKEEFLRRIDNKQILFNEWFTYFKGKESHLKNLRREYFTNLNTSPFERFFILEIDNQEYNRANVKEFIYLVSKKWSNISRRNPSPYCPYIYFHNFPGEELVEIKKELQDEEFKFLDGYTFMGAPFSPELICKEANFENKIELKIINSLEDLSLTLDKAKKRKEIFQFYKNVSFYKVERLGMKHVKIQYEQFKDLKEII